MKPRTQFQKMVCQSDKGTAPIAKRAIKWAADELTDHYAYRYGVRKPVDYHRR